MHRYRFIAATALLSFCACGSPSEETSTAWWTSTPGTRIEARQSPVLTPEQRQQLEALRADDPVAGPRWLAVLSVDQVEQVRTALKQHLDALTALEGSVREKAAKLPALQSRLECRLAGILSADDLARFKASAPRAPKALRPAEQQALKVDDTWSGGDSSTVVAGLMASCYDGLLNSYLGYTYGYYGYLDGYFDYYYTGTTESYHGYFNAYAAYENSVYGYQYAQAMYYTDRANGYSAAYYDSSGAYYADWGAYFGYLSYLNYGSMDGYHLAIDDSYAYGNLSAGADDCYDCYLGL